MTGGRTSWWAKDAAWHRRELQVELGEEFGAEGPHVLDVLCCWAQEQKATGVVRGGFRALAREAFVSVDRVKLIVAFAARVGAIDDFEPDGDERRFTCRISGFRADQDRGRSAWRMAAKRERDVTEQDQPELGVTTRNELRQVTKRPPPDQTIEPNPHISSATQTTRATANLERQRRSA